MDSDRSVSDSRMATALTTRRAGRRGHVPQYVGDFMAELRTLYARPTGAFAYARPFARVSRSAFAINATCGGGGGAGGKGVDRIG